jgi:hypothetical protein
MTHLESHLPQHQNCTSHPCTHSPQRTYKNQGHRCPISPELCNAIQPEDRCPYCTRDTGPITSEHTFDIQTPKLVNPNSAHAESVRSTMEPTLVPFYGNTCNPSLADLHKRQEPEPGTHASASTSLKSLAHQTSNQSSQYHARHQTFNGP